MQPAKIGSHPPAGFNSPGEVDSPTALLRRQNAMILSPKLIPTARKSAGVDISTSGISAPNLKRQNAALDLDDLLDSCRTCIPPPCEKLDTSEQKHHPPFAIRLAPLRPQNATICPLQSQSRKRRMRMTQMIHRPRAGNSP